MLPGSTDEVLEVYQCASICAFPSKSEGFPLALGEAMTCGLPAVGFKSCTGVNELIEDGVNGLLAEDRDDFTAKLGLLMSDQALREKLGQRAHEDIKKYAGTKIWPQWLQLVKEYIAGVKAIDEGVK